MLQQATLDMPSSKKRRAENDLRRPGNEIASDMSRDLKLYHQSLLTRCFQCGQQYDKVDDKDQACNYHAGSLDQDLESDDWVDNWGEFENPGDGDLVWRLNDSEGFIWSCCDRTGDDHRKCMAGKHNAGGIATEYARLEVLREFQPVHPPTGSTSTVPHLPI